MPELRLISIDLDDTLWPCMETLRAAEQDLYDWLRAHAPAVAERHDPGSLRAHRMDFARRRPEIAHDMTALRLAAMSELFAAHGYPEELLHAGNAVFRAARNRVRPYPEVREVLQVLRRDFILVSVTNGNAQVQFTPLRGCFHHSLMAGDVGAAKPDPRMFEQVRALSGIGWDNMLHVGDDPVRDVDAAASLGIATAWMNRNGSAWPADLPQPWVEINDMRQLVEQLQV